MRLLHSRNLPGVETEQTLTLADELARRDVFQDGTYVGQVVYRRRRLARGGSDYGWQPARSPRQTRLMTLTDAIRSLLS